MAGRRAGQPDEGDHVAVVGGSFLLGAAGQLKRDLLGTFEQAMLEHGSRPVRLRIGPPRLGFLVDVVFSPEAVRQVLATDCARYDKDVPALVEFRRFVGDGLLTSDGERWRRDRRIVAPLFTRRRIAAYVASMSSSAERLVTAWQPMPEESREADLCGPSMQYALEVLGTTVFGTDVHDAEAVIRSSVPALNEQVTRTALSPIRLPSWAPTPANRRARAARAAVWEFVERLIAQRRAEGAPEGDDLLSMLLTAEDPETGEGLDDQAVRDQALIFLLAGHETTGATLAFALHLLGRHPDFQQRVRSEISAVLGDRAVEPDDLEHLRFTTQVINEAMRLYPAGHTIVRRCREPAVLAGYEIPARRIVAVSVWAVHHDPRLWPDPYRFDPDRFKGRSPDAPESEGSGTGIPRYAHLPFGGGPRGCIGHYLAMAEMTVAVATVVRAFHLESLVERPAVDVGVSLLPVMGGLPCRLTRVDSTVQ